MEIILLVGAVAWLAAAIMLILLKFLAVEAWAAVRGETSPRLLRRQERERQRRDDGVTTVGQALSARLVARIQNPPDRQWAVKLREFFAELALDVVAEARAKHQHNMWERARRRAQQRARGWQARTGGARAQTVPRPPASDRDDIVDAEVVDDVVETAHPSDVIDEFADHGVTFDGLRHDGDAMVIDFLHHEWRVRLVGEVGGWSFTAWDADAPDTTQVRERVDGTGLDGLRAVVGRAAAHLPLDPDPADDTPTEPIPDLEETPMSDQTHTIDADVRDPRTALRFASRCCGFTDAVLGELDVLAANLARAGVGAAPIQEVRVLAEDVRNYSRSAERSIRAYEQHCVAQGDIAADEDVAGTVRRTYLDTHGSDGAATGTRRGGGSHTLRAADCDTPAAGERFMAACAAVFAEMKVSVDQVKGAHERQGVSGDPIAFLDEQLGLAAGIADKSATAARTFRGHSRRRDDTVGKDPSLHGTQDGRYLDPARA